MTDTNIETINAEFQRSLAPFLNRSRFVVGFSGGLDSTVLLHLANQMSLPVTALHIHHGLSPNANSWQAHCQAMADQMKVGFQSVVVDVNPKAAGIEAAARAARYGAFEEVLKPKDILLLGHHRDDQAETLLLRLMRGAGTRGLGAMPSERSLGRGRLLRPLLNVSRSQLEAYASAHQLMWIDDESNADYRFDRNWLRHEVMPLLEARWPGAYQRMASSALLCRESDQLNQILAKQDLNQLCRREERLGCSILLAPLQQWPATRTRNLLRFWIEHETWPLPERVHLAEIESQLIHGFSDSRAQVSWVPRGYDRASAPVMCRFKDRLFLISRLRHPATDLPRVLLWRGEEQLVLPGGGCLMWERSQGPGLLKLPVAHESGVEIRYRQGGERAHPHNRGHSQLLKKLLLEYGLEPWLRDALPLIYVDGQLAAAGDLWRERNFVTTEDEPGWQLQWRPGPIS